MQLDVDLYEDLKITDITRCGANEDGADETVKDPTVFAKRRKNHVY